MKNKTFKYDIIVISFIFIIIMGFFLLTRSDNGHLVKITVNKEDYGIYDL